MTSSDTAPAAMRRFEGKTAIVTGAGRNIGYAVAERLSDEGANIAVVDNDTDRAKTAVDRLTARGGNATALAVDVTDEPQVAQMVADTVAAYGAVDVLINNVAATINKSVLDTTLAEWQLVHDVTTTSAFLCLKHTARTMIDTGRPGAVVNFSSTSGHRGARNKFAYAVAKAGVLNLTRAAAIDLAEHHIRVNTITPTQTGSPVGKDDTTPDRGIKPGGIPLARFGQPHEQAATAAFLASDDASFITGADIPCDGGLLAAFPRAH